MTGKALLFRSLIEFAGFLYLWLCLIQPAARPNPSKFRWSVLLYTGIVLLTSATGVNPYRSFWGDLERMEGVLVGGARIVGSDEKAICEGMEWCGLALDPDRNRACVGLSQGASSQISQDQALVQAYVVAADEETWIAKETVKCLT